MTIITMQKMQVTCVQNVVNSDVTMKHGNGALLVGLGLIPTVLDGTHNVHNIVCDMR